MNVRIQIFPAQLAVVLACHLAVGCEGGGEQTTRRAEAEVAAAPIRICGAVRTHGTAAVDSPQAAR